MWSTGVNKMHLWRVYNTTNSTICGGISSPMKRKRAFVNDCPIYKANIITSLKEVLETHISLPKHGCDNWEKSNYHFISKFRCKYVDLQLIWLENWDALNFRLITGLSSIHNRRYLLVHSSLWGKQDENLKYVQREGCILCSEIRTELKTTI